MGHQTVISGYITCPENYVAQNEAILKNLEKSLFSDCIKIFRKSYRSHIAPFALSVKGDSVEDWKYFKSQFELILVKLIACSATVNFEGEINPHRITIEYWVDESSVKEKVCKANFQEIELQNMQF